eukprot:6211845-Pleurochrysis_carterae.AAC.4
MADPSSAAATDADGFFDVRVNTDDDESMSKSGEPEAEAAGSDEELLQSEFGESLGGGFWSAFVDLTSILQDILPLASFLPQMTMLLVEKRWR